MQFLSPMQLFVWVLGLVAASCLIIGLLSEWIFRIWFDAKKRFIADLAIAAGKAADTIAGTIANDVKAKKEEKTKAKVAEEAEKTMNAMAEEFRKIIPPDILEELKKAVQKKN